MKILENGIYLLVLSKSQQFPFISMYLTQQWRNYFNPSEKHVSSRFTK